MMVRVFKKVLYALPCKVTSVFRGLMRWQYGATKKKAKELELKGNRSQPRSRKRMI